MASGASNQLDIFPCKVTQIAILLKIPVEVLQHICSQLEPVWLVQLSNTCTTLRTTLSFEHGNKVWYNVLPPSMWKDAEQFQDEVELSHVMARQGSAFHIANALIQQPLFRRRQQLKSSVPSPVSPITRSPPSLSLHTGITSVPRVKYDLSPIHYNASSKPLHYLVAVMNERDPNQVLGGPYAPICNYKREILGNLNSKKRCYICLTPRSSDGKNVHVWRWNLLLCQDCYKEYTLTIGALRLMPTIFPVVNFVQNYVYRVASANTEIYFKPEIDHLLTTYTGLDFQTNLLIYRRWQQGEEKYRRETSSLEARRRIVRRLILAAAEQIWEGTDPCPVPSICADTGDFLGWRRRPYMPTEASFEVFRGRFAPTQKLKDFLFPDYALSDTPSQLEYTSATGWMEDPTMALKKNDDFHQRVTGTWICNQALNMLSCLTDWRHPEYNRKGCGGYVTNWTEACKKWHIARMEAELHSGAVLRLDYALKGLHGARHYWRIHKLRAKLGMQKEGATVMTPLPRHPERGVKVSNEDYHEFSRLEKLAAEAEQKRAEGIKHFNKIVRHACVACPDTSLLLYPMGFEGMLEHLRIWHPKLYFTSDDFHAIG